MLNTRQVVCICCVSYNNSTLHQVSLNAVKIPWQTTVKHLDDIPVHNLYDKTNICKKTGMFLAALNKANVVIGPIYAKFKLNLLNIVSLGMAFKPASWLRHKMISWMSSGVTYFLVWWIMVIFFPKTNRFRTYFQLEPYFKFLWNLYQNTTICEQKIHLDMSFAKCPACCLRLKALIQWEGSTINVLTYFAFSLSTTETHVDMSCHERA